MNWELLNLVGTAAFAITGALVGIEERYDLLGVFVLGLVTAFAGGIIKNLLIGVPPTVLWQQGGLLVAALLAVAVTVLLPASWLARWRRPVLFFDALGLAAFAIQAALQAQALRLPGSAMLVAAVLTGVGGGVVRDVLSGRKPLVFRDEVYAVWALLAGLVVWLGWAATPVGGWALFAAIVVLRMASVRWHWRLPRPPFWGSARHAEQPIDTPPAQAGGFSENAHGNPSR
jgi:uncharacterized membrane protein YeiH